MWCCSPDEMGPRISISSSLDPPPQPGARLPPHRLAESALVDKRLINQIV